MTKKTYDRIQRNSWPSVFMAHIIPSRPTIYRLYQLRRQSTFASLLPKKKETASSSSSEYEMTYLNKKKIYIHSIHQECENHGVFFSRRGTSVTHSEIFPRSSPGWTVVIQHSNYSPALFFFCIGRRISTFHDAPAIERVTLTSEFTVRSRVRIPYVHISSLYYCSLFVQLYVQSRAL